MTERITTIAAGTTVRARLVGEGDVHIDGCVEGSIVTTGTVTIGPEGSVLGDIQSENASVHGQLEGRLDVAQHVGVSATGVVSGDVICGRLSVEPGARLSGEVRTGAARGELRGDAGGQARGEARGEARGRPVEARREPQPSERPQRGDVRRGYGDSRERPRRRDERPPVAPDPAEPAAQPAAAEQRVDTPATRVAASAQSMLRTDRPDETVDTPSRIRRKKLVVRTRRRNG